MCNKKMVNKKQKQVTKTKLYTTRRGVCFSHLSNNIEIKLHTIVATYI